MRKFLLFLLAVFALLFNATTAKGKAKTLKVEDSSVGVWSIWAENAGKLSSRYAGFVKYKSGDGFELVKTKKYFANHIAMLNRDELKRQLNRGCDRGFFRCLLLGTELKLPTADIRDSKGSVSKETKEAEATAQFQTHNLANQDSQAIGGEVISRNESVLNFEENAYHNLLGINKLEKGKANSDGGGKEYEATDDTQNNRSDNIETQGGLENSVFSENKEKLKKEIDVRFLMHARTERERRDKPGPSRGQNDLHQTSSADNISTENRSNFAKNRMIDALIGNSTLQLILGFALLFFLACLWDDYARHWYKRYILGKKRVRKLKRYIYSQDE